MTKEVREEIKGKKPSNTWINTQNHNKNVWRCMHEEKYVVVKQEAIYVSYLWILRDEKREKEQQKGREFKMSCACKKRSEFEHRFMKQK